MSYQVLYRKWRPENFDDFIGQQSIITTLANQIQTGRIAHAYLFCGSRGTGKTSAAKVFARAVNCEQPDEHGNPCGQCEPCIQLAKENNMDIVEIDAASNNGVDEIRDLRDKVKYPPSVGKYRVYIIDEVHMFSTGAFNALLKTLEEPPEHAVFILATTEPHKLPTTILSRCQRFDFKRIPLKEIYDRLRHGCDQDELDYDDAALEWIARAAEGGMRDAWSILDMCLAYGQQRLTTDVVRSVLGTADRSFIFDFVDVLLKAQPGNGFFMLDDLVRDGHDVATFVRSVSQHLRDLLLAQLCKDDLAELLEITQEDAQRLLQQADSVGNEQLTRMLDLFVQAEADIKWASSARTVLELCIVKSCKPPQEQSVEALLERLERLENSVRQGVVTVAQGVEPPSLKQEKSISPEPPAQNRQRPQEADSHTPQPISQAAPTSQEERQIYDNTLKLIRKEAIAQYSPLSKAHFVGLQGDQLLLSFPAQGEIYIRMLEREATRVCVEKYFSEAFGKTIQIKMEVEGSKANTSPQDEKQNKELVNQVFDVFGRDKVEVIDD